jgi:ketosteroid isomerase-like protein
MTARELLDRYRQILVAKDWRGLGEILADDATMEFPFVPPGVPAIRRGRDAIMTAARDGWSRLTFAVEDVRVLASHGDVAAECELVTTVGTFAMAIVIEARDGKICRLREYLDLLGLAKPTGRAAAIADALLGETARAVWERMIGHHQAGDIDAFAAMFGDDGVMELGFPVTVLPARMVGRDEIRRVLGPLWQASRAKGRGPVAYDRIVCHAAREPGTVIVELELRTEDGARLAYVHVLQTAGDRIVRLRDYFDTGALARRIAA